MLLNTFLRQKLSTSLSSCTRGLKLVMLARLGVIYFSFRYPKVEKMSSTAKSALAKQASETIDLERNCRFVFTKTIMHQNVWQNSKRTGKDIENVDNRERRINAGENVSGLSGKTFLNTNMFFMSILAI